MMNEHVCPLVRTFLENFSCTSQKVLALDTNVRVSDIQVCSHCCSEAGFSNRALVMQGTSLNDSLASRQLILLFLIYCSNFHFGPRERRERREAKRGEDEENEEDEGEEEGE